jgi:large subunit ribosomal protein L24
MPLVKFKNTRVLVVTKIRKGDFVIVCRGDHAGKIGRVIAVLKPNAWRRGCRVQVDGIPEIKRHVRANRSAGRAGSVVWVGRPLDLSNVAIWNPHTQCSDKVIWRIENNVKVRCFKSNGLVIHHDTWELMHEH